MKPRHLNFDEVWCDLKKTVSGIMIDTVPRDAWYEGYLQVYHLCVATPESLADKLYSAMDQFLSDHVDNLRSAVQKDTMQFGLLRAYYVHWIKYGQSVRYLDRLFYYLNHEWVKKKRVSDADIAYGSFEIDDMVLEIGELGLDIWMRRMLLPLQDNLIDLILNAVELDRQPQNSNPDADYVKGVVDSFVEVESFRAKKKELDFYRKFEARYLEATNRFYTSVSQGLIGNIGCSAFMEKVLQYVRQEEFRSHKFLDASSFTQVIKECERVMVGDHLDFIHNEAKQMVADVNCKDLANMYILLKPLDGSCMQPLIKEVQRRVEKIGDQLLQDIDPENVPQSFVDSILTVHENFRDLIAKVFNNDQHFIAALDRACISIINSSHPKVNAKAPELLARYCDQVLKKGPKAATDQDELEKRLSRSIIVFKYLDEKDYFQKSYSKVLAKRLIHGNSASMEAEELMINMLRQACGFEYTSKLHRMYTDMALSNDLNAKFAEYVAEGAGGAGAGLGITFSVSVLQACAWPMTSQPVSPFAPPQQLERSITLFEAFYKDKFNGRKLTWLHNLSTADIRLNFSASGKPYTMTCSTFIMAVALMFEHEDSITYEVLRANTQLQDDYLTRALQALVEGKILLDDRGPAGENWAAPNCGGWSEGGSSSRSSPSPGMAVFYPKTLFTLNLQFSHKRGKFKITSAPVKEPVTGQDPEQTAATLEEDRKAYLQALIVRIMKVRKVAKHSELIEQVISQATERFRPNIALIKKCIEGLIDKQYIERMPNSTDEYSYVS